MHLGNHTRLRSIPSLNIRVCVIYSLLPACGAETPLAACGETYAAEVVAAGGGEVEERVGESCLGGC